MDTRDATTDGSISRMILTGTRDPFQPSCRCHQWCVQTVQYMRNFECSTRRQNNAAINTTHEARGKRRISLSYVKTL